METKKVFERKARLAFRFLDENKDGVLTADDFVRYSERFISLSNAPSFRAEEIRRMWKELAEYTIPDGGLTEEEYVKRAWGNGTDHELMTNLRAVNVHLFHSIDADNDGYISLEELCVYYKTFRCEDKVFVKNVFKALDKNHDGLISEDEFADAFTAYWKRNHEYEYIFNPADESMKVSH